MKIIEKPVRLVVLTDDGRYHFMPICIVVADDASIADVTAVIEPVLRNFAVSCADFARPVYACAGVPFYYLNGEWSGFRAVFDLSFCDDAEGYFDDFLLC